MTKELVSRLYERFFAYVSGFYTGNPETDQHIRLKSDHTEGVCRMMQYLCTSLSTDRETAQIAEITALFHDFGRFEQLRRYSTYNDLQSENHARLGIREILRTGIMDDLDMGARKKVFAAIACHNRAELPHVKDRELAFFMKLIRDADKLDIWRVVTDYYENHNTYLDNSTIELNMKTAARCSEKALLALQNKRIVRIRELSTKNDFKLLQIGWVYDLNFRPTFQKLHEKDYINRIAAFLPDTPEVNAAVSSARNHLETKLKTC